MSDFLEFDKVVSLARPGGFYGRQLELVERRSLGRTLQGKPVRTIGDIEFADIVRAGLQETLNPANAVKLELDSTHGMRGLSGSLKLVARHKDFDGFVVEVECIAGTRAERHREWRDRLVWLPDVVFDVAKAKLVIAMVPVVSGSSYGAKKLSAIISPDRSC